MQIPIMDRVRVISYEDRVAQSEWIVFVWDIRLERPFIKMTDAWWFQVGDSRMTGLTFPG